MRCFPCNCKFLHSKVDLTTICQLASFVTCFPIIHIQQVRLVVHPTSKCIPSPLSVSKCIPSPPSVSKVDLMNVCHMDVCLVDVHPRSPSHDCVSWMLVLKGASIVCCNPQVWTTQLVGSTCSPSIEANQALYANLSFHASCSQIEQGHLQQPPLCLILLSFLPSILMHSTSMCFQGLHCA